MKAVPPSRAMPPNKVSSGQINSSRQQREPELEDLDDGEDEEEDYEEDEDRDLGEPVSAKEAEQLLFGGKDFSIGTPRKIKS